VGINWATSQGQLDSKNRHDLPVVMKSLIPECKCRIRLRTVGAFVCLFVFLSYPALAQIANRDIPDQGVAAQAPIFRVAGLFADLRTPQLFSISNQTEVRVPIGGAGTLMCSAAPNAPSSPTLSLSHLTRTLADTLGLNIHGSSDCLLLDGKSCPLRLLEGSVCKSHIDEPKMATTQKESSFLLLIAKPDSSNLFFASAPVPDSESSAGLILPPRDLNSIRPNFDLNYLRPGNPEVKEPFHWKQAFTQSFLFLLEEHSFRMGTDPLARHLVWRKRFWDDYLQSANHFVMTRWGDGDDFLVNYIGHPLQGSVSGLIEIQNDPRGRSAKFGKSSLYWQSRMKAMLWAGVYSAYFEIGPIFSEAALGNEGGYTYTPRCGLGYCSKPPLVFKPPTNNTGWVDFIVTPVVGTGWTILEDSIEREIVDRIAKDDPRFRYKLIRAGLSPSHAMANMLAGKYPWYRVTDADEAAMNSSMAYAQTHLNEHLDEARDTWEIGIGYTNLNLPRDQGGCTNCRVNNSGLALNFDRRLTRWFTFDAETDVFPGTSYLGMGNATEGLFGAKIGHPNRTWGMFTTLRIGFIYYDKAHPAQNSNQYVNLTRFASDVGEVFEYYPSTHSTVRFGVGDTMVRYLTGRVDPDQPPVSVLTTDFVSTHSNLQIRSEYVYRF
jgi:hypothetical protein